ncbi:hypothetical protein C8Q78DRAFT_568587 [Trametes maxima]|nr:hypothetical protein C8Q78DRAFT_568587 [Trametes maxima]
MHKVLLLFFWAGRLVDHELASLPCLPSTMLSAIALILAAYFGGTIIPTSTLGRPQASQSQNVPDHNPNIGGHAPVGASNDPPSKFVNCTPAEARAIRNAIPLSTSYIVNAARELGGKERYGDNYVHWFGTPNAHRFSIVQSCFEGLRTNNFTEYSFTCNSPECTTYNAEYAFVDNMKSGIIHLCHGFFAAPEGGRNSQASTIVHEATHFWRNAYTDDIARGVSGAEQLARARPDLAVKNAENYEFFAADARDPDYDLASLDVAMHDQSTHQAYLENPARL